jgi:hypothetical protein
MRPTSLSYGPEDPKDCPPAHDEREVMVTLVTSADVGRGCTRQQNDE